MAALVIHAAALELAKEVKEAVFIGGITAQLLKEKFKVRKTNRKKTHSYLLKFHQLFIYFYWNQDALTSCGGQIFCTNNMDIIGKILPCFQASLCYTCLHSSMHFLIEALTSRQNNLFLYVLTGQSDYAELFLDPRNMKSR